MQPAKSTILTTGTFSCDRYLSKTGGKRMQTVIDEKGEQHHINTFQDIQSPYRWLFRYFWPDNVHSWSKKLAY
ncbi:hypothetical protein TNCV_5001411 [Trichonephila clavipes]|nr:hypothetical protein TNCV_5001411 [Trichonephila clavipes]